MSSIRFSRHSIGIGLMAIFSLSLCTAAAQPAAKRGKNHTILNNTFWDTVDGHPIYSQGGGIFTFKDPATGKPKYFWYGVRYKESAAYRADPSITHAQATFASVTCYSSNDLINWTFENNVMDSTETNKNDKNPWVGRLGVAYIDSIGKYALFVQHQAQVLVALADAPTGPFRWHQLINMQDRIGTTNTGDQTVFTDDDTGKSYLVYSYGRGRNKIYVSEIGIEDGKVGLLDCTEIFRGEGREGNCMFKYKGKYYMAASNLYGWDSSFAYYLVADDVRGPYQPTNDMQIMQGSEADYAHVTQTGFFVRINGSKQETIVYCGDRWANFAGNGLGYNQWLPLSFDGSQPIFNSLSAWTLNAKTGEWNVDSHNNYVKNGSFEADRRHIPSPVKPVQEQLLGWHSSVLRGNPISVTDSLSPVLNYFNSQADRKIVTGEKSLLIQDRVDFSRTVTQHIASTSTVVLQDGYYTLRAKVKNSGGFSMLEMYASSGGKFFSEPFGQENKQWVELRVDNVRVKGGKIEIGFRAQGTANAFCYIDDVSLTKHSR